MGIAEDLNKALKGVGVDMYLACLFRDTNEDLKTARAHLESIRINLEERITYADNLEQGAAAARRFLEGLRKRFVRILEMTDDEIRGGIEDLVSDLEGVQEKLDLGEPDPNKECEIVFAFAGQENPQILEVSGHDAAKIGGLIGLKGQHNVPQIFKTAGIEITIRKRGDMTPPVEC